MADRATNATNQLDSIVISDLVWRVQAKVLIGYLPTRILESSLSSIWSVEEPIRLTKGVDGMAWVPAATDSPVSQI